MQQSPSKPGRFFLASPNKIMERFIVTQGHVYKEDGAETVPVEEMPDYAARLVEEAAQLTAELPDFFPDSVDISIGTRGIKRAKEESRRNSNFFAEANAVTLQPGIPVEVKKTAPGEHPLDDIAKAFWAKGDPMQTRRSATQKRRVPGY
jgi:hypothetical protein